MSDDGSLILTDVFKRVLTIRFNRAAALNAFTDRMYSLFDEILQRAAVDDGVACVLVTGRGRAFSVGQDLKEMDEYPKGSPGAPSFAPMCERWAAFPKPTVCAVNGLAIGWGFTLLGHADAVIMSSDARCRAPFTGLGLTAEGGSSHTFPAIMGWQRAAHTLLTGDWLDASGCLQAGIALEVTSPDDLAARSIALAQRIAAKPLVSLVATKELMLKARGVEEALRSHRREQAAFSSGLVGGLAHKEAQAAFAERREPDFSKL
jgi:enoyl-CoA hydratase/carnithine racemase